MLRYCTHYGTKPETITQHGHSITKRLNRLKNSGEQIEACSSGKLEGAPDLTRNGCTDSGTYAGRVYWRCPAPVASGP